MTRPKRTHGDGHLRTTSSGAYLLEVMLGTDEQGRRVRRAVTGKNLKDLRAKRDELVARWRGRTLVATAAAERQPLADWLTAWLEGRRAQLEPSTWLRYAVEVRRRLIPALGRVPLATLTPTQVRRAYATMVAGTAPFTSPVSARTVIHTHTTLHGALEQALRDGLVVRNVAAMVQPPRPSRREVRVLTPAEVQGLLTIAAEPWRTLWLLAAYTGMREGELLGLCWRDVTTTPAGSGAIHVRQVVAIDHAQQPVLRPYPKRKSSVRTIPVGQVVIAALQVHRQRQDDLRQRAEEWEDTTGLLFASRYGGPLRASNVVRAFKADAAMAGLAHAHLHLLRHTYASSLLAAGRPISEVAYLLGHSSASTTLSVYAHWVRNTGADTPAVLERYYDQHGEAGTDVVVQQPTATPSSAIVLGDSDSIPTQGH